MKVFVTGGSGFVGGHVLEALSTEHEVLALARSERSAGIVEGFGAVAVSGSLEDVDAAMLAGVDAVVHVAAYVEEYGPLDAYWQANVEGTQRVLDAAREAGVGRFVHCSTNATVFDRLGQRGVDESAPYPEHRGFPYGATKAESERRVLAADVEGFTTVAVRPCFVWGPRDNSVLPALRRMVADGGFVWVDGGRALVSTTHVDNLVHGLMRALVADGVGGRAFFVADEGDVTIRQFLSGLAEADGLALSGPSLPGWMVRTAARAAEWVWGRLGRQTPPPVTRMAADLMSRDMTVRTERARAELGWTPVVSRTEALAQLAAPFDGTAEAPRLATVA